MYGRLTSSVFWSSTTLRIYSFESVYCSEKGLRTERHTWIDLNRDRCLAAISWYSASTASVLDISLYSLYMLCVPERES